MDVHSNDKGEQETMREIKFRGLDYDHKWNYGNYECRPENGCRGDYIDGIEVIFKTVGQFTGLIDKNGAEVYDGDILRIPVIREDYRGIEYINAELIWDDKTAAYKIMSGNRKVCVGSSCDIHNCQVVGNIWDNPELL